MFSAAMRYFAESKQKYTKNTRMRHIADAHSMGPLIDLVGQCMSALQ